MFTRRQILATGTAATVITPAIAPAATQAAPKITSAATPADPHWDSEICWLPGNRPAGHRWTLRAPPGGKTFTASIDYAAITPRDFPYQLFHGDGLGISGSTNLYGLGAHYNTLDTTRASTARNVIDANAPADKPVSSIWLVAWGESTAAMVTPEVDEHGQPIWYTTKPWNHAALAVIDWRYIVRIANLDFDADGFRTSVLMRKAFNLLPWVPAGETGTVKRVRLVFYAPAEFMRRKGWTGNPLNSPTPVRGIEMLNIHENRVV
jgi:hypothetical protein